MHAHTCTHLHSLTRLVFVYIVTSRPKRSVDSHDRHVSWILEVALIAVTRLSQRIRPITNQTDVYAEVVVVRRAGMYTYTLSNDTLLILYTYFQ